jgi:hypothetical protein
MRLGFAGALLTGALLVAGCWEQQIFAFDAGAQEDGGGQPVTDGGPPDGGPLDGGDTPVPDGGPPDAGQAGDGGPPLALFGPSLSWARVEAASETFPEPLTVTLEEPAHEPVRVRVVSSHPDIAFVLSEGVQVPQGEASARVRVVGLKAGTAILTASLGTQALEAQVQVLSGSEIPQLESLDPAGVFVSPGVSREFRVTMSIPVASATTIGLSMNPSAGFASSVPSTVTVQPNTRSATFPIGIAPVPTAKNGILTATLGSQSRQAQLSLLRPLLISEISPKLLNEADNEFVELYNPNDQDVPLQSFTLKYLSTALAAIQVDYATFTSQSGSVPAHGYFLVAHERYDGGVPPDATTAQQLAAGGAHIILVRGTEEIDRVGYGSGTTMQPEGGAAAAIPASGSPTASQPWSIERKALPSSTDATMSDGGVHALLGNAWDTDNNAADFIIREVRDPQNRSSPREQIPAP